MVVFNSLPWFTSYAFLFGALRVSRHSSAPLHAPCGVVWFCLFVVVFCFVFALMSLCDFRRRPNLNDILLPVMCQVTLNIINAIIIIIVTIIHSNT